MKKILSVIAILASALSIGCAGEGKYKSVGNNEFARLIADPQTQLVDVRTAEEYAAGHIPGAVNINVQLTTFADDIAVLDPARPVAVYCRSGVRSVKAAEILTDKGFKVYNLKEGFLSWDGEKTEPEPYENPSDEPEVVEGNLGHRHASDIVDE
ncbi:MAG: rhodanese-like domain-containing protein [Bacteroidales bacterium]|nr:rhodanese-like domain-containing protein [Bacteroidales bacterium]